MFEKYSRYILLIIISLAFFIRCIGLDRIPTGINNDELVFAINSKVLLLHGSGLSDYHPPINITKHFPNVELPSILMMPFVGLFPFTLFSSRIFFVLLGSCTILLLYEIVKNILGRSEALVVALVAMINPWNIVFSRIIYDAPVTTFFLLLGFYLLLSRKKWIILSSIISFFFAFHTYMGMMIVFPFFVGASLVFAYIFNKKQHLVKYYIFVGTICAFFVVRYLLLLPTLPSGSRLSEISKPTDTEITYQTDVNRRLSLKNSISKIYVNKYFTYSKTLLTKYMSAFSPEVLFLNGDTRIVFSFSNHGFFYIIDCFFLLMGFACMLKNKPNVCWFLFFLVLISPLPSTISKEGLTFASRSYLLQPIFLIFIGYGIYYTINYITNKKLRTGFIIGCLTIYIVFFSNFAYTYFIKSPIANSEGYNFSSREMIHYANLERNKNRTVIIISNEPKTHYLLYAFYQNILNRTTIQHFVDTYTSYNSKDLEIDSVLLRTCVDKELFDEPNTTILVEGDPICPNIPKTVQHKTIAMLADSGSVYSIYNGKTCSEEVSDRYPHDISYYDLNIDTLSEARFCNKFITQY
jgi:4-amino-4-deoxy-L-arabinose transferase-like glycosyltransferase